MFWKERGKGKKEKQVKLSQGLVSQVTTEVWPSRVMNGGVWSWDLSEFTLN
jgi:hypothetical protein